MVFLNLRVVLFTWCLIIKNLIHLGLERIIWFFFWQSISQIYFVHIVFIILKIGIELCLKVDHLENLIVRIQWFFIGIFLFKEILFVQNWRIFLNEDTFLFFRLILFFLVHLLLLIIIIKFFSKYFEINIVLILFFFIILLVVFWALNLFLIFLNLVFFFGLYRFNKILYFY